MQRKCAMLLALSYVLATTAFAQGLNTQASKDDWEEINFEFNSAVLSDGYPSLLCLADQLHKNPNYRVKVEGNTDNIGSERVNEKLGLARANTVRDFLVKYGASPNQIEVATRGKRDPKYPGFKSTYSKTDVARWMNRRVVLTVTDQNGKLVAAGCGVSPAPPPAATAGGPNCCDDILAKLDKITALLQDLKDENAALRDRVAKLEAKDQALDTTINNMPKPMTPEQTSNVVDARLEHFRDPRFSLLGLNIGADDLHNVTFTGAGRFFAPFKDHFAVQIQGEYLYFKTQKEAQADIGLVNRYGRFQGGLFASFKNVSMSPYSTATIAEGSAVTASGTAYSSGYSGNGTIGEAALVFDYIFKWGKVGVFGTKGFLNNAVLNTQNATFTDPSGNLITAPNIFIQNYLHIVDQVGVQGTVGLWGNNYMEANIGYLKSAAHADRPGGTVRFIFPLNSHFAFTLEGGLNETLLAAGNSGRAMVGIQFGNLLRPKDFASDDHPEPMQVPRVRYEVLARTLHRGVSPPVANAGPNQIGVPAGAITLNGSGSYDPNGETLTYQWVQEGGPTVALQNANQPIATFTAVAGAGYTFMLTVRNTDNQQASARTVVTTVAAKQSTILLFIANPTNINVGQSSQLTWQVQNANTVTISPNVGSVNKTNGTVSVSPTTTTTYTLTATNGSGSQTATATVTVNQPQPTISVCTAVPMSIMAGESTTIYYQTQNATSVTISPTTGSSLGDNGSVVVSPTTSTTYTLMATNQYGSTTCSVGVTVTPGTAPRVVKFSGSPLTIAQGSSSTLLWVTEGATSVSIDQGVGNVDVAGTTSVTPAQTTTYTLTAKNNTGSTTAQVTITVTPSVTVGPSPTVTSFTGSPNPSPSPGTAVVLSCLTQNAKTTVISGVGPVSTSGTLTVYPQATTTYVCVATPNNPSQAAASANLTITVTPSSTGPTAPTARELAL